MKKHWRMEKKNRSKMFMILYYLQLVDLQTRKGLA